MRWVLTRLGAAAMTLNGVAYVKAEDWGDNRETAALAVHEATHAEQWRTLGVAVFLWRYLSWRVTHPRTPIAQHPLEEPAYRAERAVVELWTRGAGDGVD